MRDETNLFPRLTSRPILPGIISLAPAGEMMRIMTGFGPDVTIREYAASIRASGGMDRFRDRAVADLVERRDAGTLPAIESSERFGYADTWNAFVSDSGDPDAETAAELASPVMAMIEARVVSLCTRTKNAIGRIRDDHLDRPIEDDNVARRLADAEARLVDSLREGTSLDPFRGAFTERERPGSAMVTLRDGLPVIMIRRAGAKEAWHEADARPDAPGEDPSPSP